MDEIYFALCKSVDSPLSLKCWMLYKNGWRDPKSHVDLSNLSINPRDYADAASFGKDYTVVKFLSKWKGLNTGIDLREVAIQKFATSEDRCVKTNERLVHYRSTTIPVSGTVDVGAILFGARRLIAKVLGPNPSCTLRSCSWTSGSTTTLKKAEVFRDTKVSEFPIPITRAASSYIASSVATDPNWFESLTGIKPLGPYSLLRDSLSLQDGGHVDWVPKDAKSDRTIVKEPGGNMFLQKGVGNYIRKRLRTVGIDLNDQSINQDLALRALPESLATIDLESASDCLALELVYELLPLDWAVYLDAIRSKRVRLNKAWLRIAKFSSMGNGFTFELESLIFWAVARSASDLGSSGGVVSVYGDDIIVSQSNAAAVIEALSFCGFATNVAKTYLDGVFFESCGRHYFENVDVTPIYQKENLDEVEIVRCGNRIRRLAYRTCDRAFRVLLRNPWLAARRAFPGTLGLHLPMGSEADVGWLVSEVELGPLAHRRCVSRGILCRVLRASTVALPGNPTALLARSLREGIQHPSVFELCIGYPRAERPQAAYVDDLETPSTYCIGNQYNKWVVPTREFYDTW